MKTGLGLNFLRIVNEEGFDGWAQVYARVPFDDAELMKKGSLFGVIYSNDLDDWTSKEADIMTWVDQYFNEAVEPDVSTIDNYLKEKYPDLSGVWMWVNVEDGKRAIRIVKNREIGVWLWREGEKNDLGNQMVEGKTLKGSIMTGDKLVIWAGEMKPFLEEVENLDSQETVVQVGDKLLKDNRGGASLVFDFTEIDSSNENEEKIFSDGSLVTDSETPVLEHNSFVPVENPSREVPEMVSSNYVGQVGFKEKLYNWWNSKAQRRRSDISIGGVVSKRKKMAMGLGVLFLILLAISIVSGSIKIKADSEQKRWSQFYEPIEKKRLEAEGLSSINLVGSRKMMEEVKTSFESGKGDFVNSKFKNQLVELENKINSTWATASGEKMSTLVTSVNIALVREGFNGKRLSLVEDKSFLALDEKMGLVVSADGATKDVKVLAGKGEGLGWIDVLHDGKRNLLLDSSGISVIETSKRISTFDDAVSRPIALGVFGANIYVLDQGNKEVYRYNNGTDSLGDRNRWLKQDESISKEPVDMSIDGDIWILEQENELERFRRGSKENFSLNGVPEKAMFSKVAVSAVDDKIALLDTANGSISVFKKEDGSFIEQLKMDGLREASDIEFDDEGGLWVLIKGVLGGI